MATGDEALDPAPAARTPRKLVNVNVGVLGHVDSGKTHLVRVLSTHLSTAALDKHPQSQQRGMTLDLGFSAFRISSNVPNGPELQITLVDCPGHASLFKTILGGVHIIDSVLLVVDIQKGLQPQTIECLLLAELAVSAQIVVALNKIDLVPEPSRAARILQVEREIREFLSQNFKIFDATQVPVVPVAAAPAGSDSDEAIGIAQLVETIQRTLPVLHRDDAGPLCFAVDHCFAIQGNGTILTGTVLSGSVRVGDEIELPALYVTKKIKSMQMFKRNVESASQGDRVAVRVNGLDASLVERGMATTPRSLPFVKQAVIRVQQIPFFAGKCKTGGKIHVTVGHTTVVAVVTFFQSHLPQDREEPFDPKTVYQAVREVESIATRDTAAESELNGSKFQGLALLQFEQPVICPPKAVVVCSRFDLDPKKFHCRLAFHGAIDAIVWDNNDDTIPDKTNAIAPQSLRLRELKIGTVKERYGVMDKPIQRGDAVTEVLARDMFAKDVDWQVYTGKTVLFEPSNTLGTILGPFGKSGKFRIELIRAFDQSEAVVPATGDKVVLRFVKLATLRPLKRADDKANGKPTSTDAAKHKKSTCNLLQDSRILYPEAFVQKDPIPQTPTESQQAQDRLSQQATEEPVQAQAAATGRIERLKGETSASGRNPLAIVTGLFTDEATASASRGRRVRCMVSNPLGSVEMGEIDKPFGKAGKVRVVFPAHGGTLGQVGDCVELA